MGRERQRPVRTHGWRGRLFAYLAEAQRRPFEYGVHDCTLFACGAVEAITGVDLGAEYRGKYTSYAGGLALLRKNGLMDHVDMAASLFERISPAETVMGDVVVVRSENGSSLGVVQGSGKAFVLTLEGMSMVDAIGPHVETAFRIE